MYYHAINHYAIRTPKFALPRAFTGQMTFLSLLVKVSGFWGNVLWQFHDVMRRPEIIIRALTIT